MAVIASLISTPETLKVVDEEEVPYVVFTADKVPVEEIVGVGQTFNIVSDGKEAVVALVPNHFAGVTKAAKTCAGVPHTVTLVEEVPVFEKYPFAKVLVGKLMKAVAGKIVVLGCNVLLALEVPESATP